MPHRRLVRLVVRSLLRRPDPRLLDERTQWLGTIGVLEIGWAADKCPLGYDNGIYNANLYFLTFRSKSGPVALIFYAIFVPVCLHSL